MPGHDDLGRAEQRSRGPRAARLRDRARHQLHRHRRDVSGAAERKHARAHRNHSGRVARTPSARQLGHRHQGRRPGAPRLDPRWPDRSDARGHRRGRRYQSLAIADRRHRPLSDPLAAAQRADVRRDRVRSLEGKGRAFGARAGRRHGRDDQGRKDPLLRPVERDGVGRVRIPPRRSSAFPVR